MKRKRAVKLVAITVLFVVFAVLVLKIISKVNYKDKVSERIQVIPPFLFVTLENEPFTNVDLSSHLNKLFIYFNSECDYCHAEAQQIKDQIEEFKGIEIIFISYETNAAIKKFAQKYEFDNQENLIFLQDKNLQFSKIFDAHSIPFMLLYSKQDSLIQKFKGAIKMERILDLLESGHSELGSESQQSNNQ